MLRRSSLLLPLPLLLLVGVVGITASACDDNFSSLPPSGGFIPPSGGPTFPTGCDPQMIECGGACTPIERDPYNCGRCNNVCGAGMQCRTGRCTLATGFAIRKIFYGDTDRTGTKSSDAWKTYGRDIDGVLTTGQPLCKPALGAPIGISEDGEGGLDNSFGRNIVPLLAQLVPDPSTTASPELERGARTMLLHVTEWELGAMDATTVFTTFLTAEKQSSPRWDGNDIRDIVPFPTSSPATVGFTSEIVDGAFEQTTGYRLGLGLLVGKNKTLALDLRDPRFTMKLAPGGHSASEGSISGVLIVSELVQQIADFAAATNKDLCSGPNIEAIKQSVRYAADVPSSTTNEPESECDAISIGIGFEAGLVVVGRARDPDPPASALCSP